MSLSEARHGCTEKPRRKVCRRPLEAGNEHPSRSRFLILAFCRRAHGGIAARDTLSGAELPGGGVAIQSAWKGDAEDPGAQGWPVRLHGYGGRAAGAGQRGERKFVLVDLCVEPVR